MSRLTITVSGMSCAGCEQRIRTVLGRLDGVGAVEADHTVGTVVVDYDPAAVDEAAVMVARGRRRARNRRPRGAR